MHYCTYHVNNQALTAVLLPVSSVLRRGGTAVDAAVAALFCDGLLSSQSMGVGGGFLMTIFHQANGSAEALDARETAPAAAKVDMFHGNANATLIGI